MSERTTRILGKMMSQFIGKKVVVAGNLTNVSSHGKCVEITTFDKMKINVTLKDPLEVNAEGMLEVWGTVKSRGTIEASHCVHFDAENSKDFDEKAYNNLIIVQHAIHDQRWKLDKNRRAL